MNESAPFKWLLDEIERLLLTLVQVVAQNLAGIVAPLAAVCFSIYILLILISYLRGAETEIVFDFGIRMVGFALVIGMGLNGPTYVATIFPIVAGLGGDLAGAVTGMPTVSAIDALMLHYLGIMEVGLTEAADIRFPSNIPAYVILFVKIGFISIGLFPLLIAGALALLTAKVGLLMVAMVGPIFFAFLLFPATRQYFSAWVNTVISYALIPLFVAVVAGISIQLSAEMMGGATLLATELSTIMMASVCNLLLVFMMRQASSLASSLSAGGINAAVSKASAGGAAKSIASGGKTAAAGAKAAGKAGAAAVNGIQSAYGAASNAFNAIRKAG